MPPKKWGPGIPDLKKQKFFDFGELGKIEANGYEEKGNGASMGTGDVGLLQSAPADPEERQGERSSYNPRPRSIQAALRILCLALALCAAVVSTTNSFEYFKSLRPTWVAFLMAVTMVGSGSLLPDLGVYLWQYRHKITAIFVALCGILAISFCMVTTLAALYNTRTVRTEVTYAQDKSTDSKIKAADDARLEEVRITGELERTNALILSTQSKIDKIPAEDTLSDISQVLQGRLNRYLKDKKSYEDRLVVLQGVTSAAVGTTAHRSDFYAFVASIFGKKDSDKVEFLTGAVPSVFLEIVTPIMLGVALFL